MRPQLTHSLAALALLLLATPALAQQAQDAGVASTPQFAEGDVITMDQADKLKPYLPDQFWDNRDFFFYEGMQLKIGPTMRDYTPNSPYMEASAKYAGQARIGPDDSIENYTAGRPFDVSKIDCTGDPQAGTKIMWNFMKALSGDGEAHFFYSYWDRGEQLPLYYQGTGNSVKLSQRYEPQYQETNGDIFRGEKRIGAFGAHVEAPFDARGIELLTYRYRTSDLPRDKARNDDTWVYVPTLRRVRRISSAQRTDAVAGTDFTFDDLRSFNGIVPQYTWECLAERRMIAPMNTQVKGYPYEKDHNFGPYGLSFASDNWELRDSWLVRMTPKNEDHPYHHKDIWIDKQAMAPLYSFAYDRKEELWKIIWHNKRWSEDTGLTGEWFPGWDGVEEPRALPVIADIIVNVQTGTGNRIEFWDASGVPPPSKGKIRRFIDVGRLTKGR